MDYRSVLEVFKFLPIEMFTQVALTSSQWNQIACSPELLQQLREDFHFPVDSSFSGRLNVVTQLVLGLSFANLSVGLQFYRCDLDRWTGRVAVDVELQGIVGYSALFLPDTSLLVTGGEFNDKRPGNTARKQFRRVFRIMRDGTFTRLKNMVERRKSHALSLVAGSLYAFGGRGRKAILSSCEKLTLKVYSPANSSNAFPKPFQKTFLKYLQKTFPKHPQKTFPKYSQKTFPKLSQRLFPKTFLKHSLNLSLKHSLNLSPKQPLLRLLILPLTNFFAYTLKSAAMCKKVHM